jgi:pimeloyl-ACP methyl ester carboxylesterase
VVLVAQGYGTFIARQYAKDHRDNVGGMVLIDPPLWMYAVQPPTSASKGVIDEYASLLDVDHNLGSYGAGALPPPPVPTVVIGVDGTKTDLPPAPVAGASLDGVQSTTTLQPLPDPTKRNDDQRQLAQKSPFGRYQQLDSAGADAQYWSPDDVAATIMSVVNTKGTK